MMKRLLPILFCMSLVVSSIYAQSTAFTYQGSLKDGANQANGNYDFQFLLFDTLSNGTQFGTTISANGVTVTNGIFAVPLDFGSQFPGSDRYLEIRVRLTGQPGFTILDPRQLIKSSPYSVKSLNTDTATNATNATTATNALSLGGVSANQYVVTTDPRMTDARPPTAGSTNYIQNGTSSQPSSNFNISGNGIAGGILSGSEVNAETRYNLAGSQFIRAGDPSQSGSIFVGVNAGTNINAVGISNSFFGTNSGFRLATGGDGNSFFGASSGFLNSTGKFNSFFGQAAGSRNSTGINNTAVGLLSDVGNILNNATAIGAYASVAVSNSLVLGSISGVNDCTPANNCADINVGIGTAIPLKRLHIKGAGDQEILLESSDVGGTRWSLQSSSVANGGGFEIINRTTNSSKFTLLSSGNVGIGTTAPADKLQVSGIISVTSLGSSGSTSLCRNSINQISACSSSLRYKKNIGVFAPGLLFVNKLRPITFDWNTDGMKDIGFGAEDIEKIDPRFVTYNEKGEVEGVKYDRLSVAFVNAFREQQEQISDQQKQIEAQRKQMDRQQAEIDALKKLVCSTRRKASVCR